MILGEGQGVGCTKECRIILHLAAKSPLVPPMSYVLEACYMAWFRARRMQQSAGKPRKILHQSYIPRCIRKKRIFGSLVQEMQEFFKKTFFVGERDSLPEVAKHRTSLIESTDVLHQKCRCFHQRSPMFLFSEKADDSPVHGMPLWRRLPCGIGPPTKIQIMITNLDKRQVQPYQRIFSLAMLFLDYIQIE